MINEVVEKIKKITEEVFFDELFYGRGGYCVESDGTIRRATQEELQEAITNPETVWLKGKSFTSEEILNEWKKVNNLPFDMVLTEDWYKNSKKDEETYN